MRSRQFGFPEHPKLRVCEECGESYEPRAHQQKFCGAKCRWLKWESEHPRVMLRPKVPRPRKGEDGGAA